MLLTIINEHRQLGSQIFSMAWADLRKTYRGALFGWAWSLVRPAIMIFVYWFVLGKGLRAEGTLGEGVSYVAWLLVGILPWFYIRDMLSAGTNAFRRYTYLVTKIKFPISTIPTFIGLSNLLVHTILIGLIMVVLVLSGNDFNATLIQLPLYTFIMFSMMVFWSLLAAPLAAISKDFHNLIKSTTQMLFWLSGILFSIDVINNDLARSLLRLNPINFIVEGYRKSLVTNEWFFEDTRSLMNFGFLFLALVITSLYMYGRASTEMADTL